MRFNKKQSKLSAQSLAYATMMTECPNFAKAMIRDLLEIDGFTDMDIAFGAGVPVHTIREALYKREYRLTQGHFISLLEFFARAFSAKKAQRVKRVCYL